MITTFFTNFKSVLTQYLNNKNNNYIYLNGTVIEPGYLTAMAFSNIISQLYISRNEDSFYYDFNFNELQEYGIITVNDIELFQNSDEFKFQLLTSKPKYFTEIIQCIIDIHDILNIKNINVIKPKRTYYLTIEEYYRKHK